MEKKDRESERLRVEVTRKFAKMGIKRDRWLNLAESREFLATGKVPAGVLALRTFTKTPTMVQSLPNGSVCLCCGEDLSGKPGVIVEITGCAGPWLATICSADMMEIVTRARSAVPKAAPASVPAPAPVAQATVSALDTPQPAEKQAEPASAEKTDGENPTPQPSAVTGDFLAAVDGVRGWKARATPDAKNAVEKLTKFLSEFSYFREGVSMRLVNTFARAADKEQALLAYCEVSQMEDLPDLVEKMKSPEFGKVVDAFNGFSPKPVNKRLAIFYGPPGGGKTVAAQKAGENANGDGKCEVVPCSPSMDAAETLYAYRLDYETGKRGYIPTALLSAMENGRTVVLDEINLLPMEARMFLQNILDNKDSISVMGKEIRIRDGFAVIGTMNPETGIGASPLPLPLVDRAAVVRKFTTSASQTAVGAGLC